MMVAARNLSSAQQDRLLRFGVSESVDIHCHCLPALDDGPTSLAEAVALCRALVADGLTTVIATPHQLGRFQGRNDSASVRRAVSALNAGLADSSVPLTIVPGGDVRLDERIEALLRDDQILTLADAGRYVMIEPPAETFIDLRPLVMQLAAAGVTTVISHPERCEPLARRPQAVFAWIKAGAAVQITAASLVGQFGPQAERSAWSWLTCNVPAIVATDAHDTTDRRPLMSQAVNAIADRLGHAVARRTCLENPLRILSGQPLCERGGETAGSRPAARTTIRSPLPDPAPGPAGRSPAGEGDNSARPPIRADTGGDP